MSAGPQPAKELGVFNTWIPVWARREITLEESRKAESPAEKAQKRVGEAEGTAL